MNIFQSYGFIIAVSVILIVSYLFNIISKRTGVPSVLMLITTGIGIRYLIKATGMSEEIDFFSVLEILGIIGLIMIVLEAALDLKLTRDKRGLIIKSFSIALISLMVNAFVIAYVIQMYIDADYYTSLIYAIPLSIISSAIVIPSVNDLSEYKKEFMIYESTFSDIFGIMFFYFLIQHAESSGVASVSFNVVFTIIITVALAVAISYGLVFLFQNIKTEVKLFLLIAVLLLLYSIGKTLHLSSLIIILVFGLLLSNRHIFFRGKLAWHIKEDAVDNILKDFRLVTLESSFVVRTFFFIIFGTTISLATLFNGQVVVVSIIILGILFGVRYLVFRLFFKKDINPMFMIAPRGLITVLLFFAIPESFQVSEFNSGVLLMVIIVSSVVMAYGLMRSKRNGKITEESETDTPEGDGLAENTVADDNSAGVDSSFSEELVTDSSDASVEKQD